MGFTGSRVLGVREIASREGDERDRGVWGDAE